MDLYHARIEYTDPATNVATFVIVHISASDKEAARDEANRIMSDRADADYGRAYSVRRCSALELMLNG